MNKEAKNQIKPPVKIMTAVPFYRDIEPETSQSIQALNSIHSFSFEHHAIKNSSLTRTRNHIMQLCIDTGADFLLGVDSDTKFTNADFLTAWEYMQKENLDIIFCSYRAKEDLEKLAAGKFVEGFPGDPILKDPVQNLTLEEEDWCSVVFFIISRKLIEKLEGSWFRCMPYKRSDGKPDTTPEDIGFCLYLKENNIPIRVLHGTGIEHIVRADEGALDPNSKTVTLKLPKSFIPTLIKKLEEIPFNLGKLIMPLIGKQLDAQGFGKQKVQENIQ